MAEVDGNNDLALAKSKTLLKTSLESSRAIASALEDSGKRFNMIRERFPSLEASVMSINPKRKSTFCAIRDRVDHTLGPVAAVLKVYDSILKLEMSLTSVSGSDVSCYLNLLKQLEEAMRFLADSCCLAMQWLQDILQFIRTNKVENNLYVINVKKSLRILQELRDIEKRAFLNGGLLYAAIGKLETDFGRLVAENSSPVALWFFSTGNQACTPIPEAVIQNLQAIIGRLSAGSNQSSLKKCLSTFAEVRTQNVQRSFEALYLGYLEKPIIESDRVRDIEQDIDRWCRHFEFAVKYVYELEYKFCNVVFGKFDSNIWEDCFAKIVTQSGLLSFLHFGKKVTNCKNDPIKLLKLLDIFRCLDNLRMDFNKLFVGQACAEIQTETRELTKRLVKSTCEILWEIPIQLKLQRTTSPPPDGSVPKLVSFVTSYCNQLLGDTYKPILTQILTIHLSWKHEKYQAELLTNQVICIVKEIGLNLDAWTKAHLDTPLSYIFMMNNHCHFCSLKGTKLGDLMGDSWLSAHQQCKNYYMALYLRESWKSIINLLIQVTQIPASPTRILSGDIKKSLKVFNEAFDALYVSQSNWVVPDEDLRLKICKLVVQDLVPTYRSYLEAIGLNAEGNSSPRKCVKYTPQGMETILGSLFQPKLIKFGTSKRTHFIGKIEDVVTDHFRLPLVAL